MSEAQAPVDRRQQIIDEGLAILREEGLRGFTQPRIAARAGLRQSNLTYYFPTRTDLLTAVATAAVQGQLAAASGVVARVSTSEQAAEGIAGITTRHEATRVLVSLAQAADQEPTVRALFETLVDGLTAEIRTLFGRLGIAPEQSNVDLVHALAVGLSVINLATNRRDAKVRAKEAVHSLLPLLATEPTRPAGRRASSRKSPKAV
ncbi:TetR/AcrR family transcriptional regulator [Variovorax rhizosphaerae]|uniref:TetR family transcriptional regulator n=1 Tax=Variovorax rhizosphaerae TaxID=1836200 RepID=A0ABU8WLD3_9BURK